MWLRLPCDPCDRFLNLNDEIGDLFVLPNEEYPDSLPGIYFGHPDQGLRLLRFSCVEHAAESLTNLFRRWQQYKSAAIYLFPVGNDWDMERVTLKK